MGTVVLERTVLAPDARRLCAVAVNSGGKESNDPSTLSFDPDDRESGRRFPINSGASSILISGSLVRRSSSLNRSLIVRLKLYGVTVLSVSFVDVELGDALRIVIELCASLFVASLSAGRL